MAGTISLELEKLNKIYPNSGFVLIPAYNEKQWEGRQYDSQFDNKATSTHWNTSPLSYEEAQLKQIEGYRIGWVVPKGMVVVDIDNKEEPRTQEYIERLLEKFEVEYSYNYTFHGMHMLFKDPSEKIPSGSKSKCGLNLVIDTRANKTGYIILPCNDPHRAWGRWRDFVEDVPYFLTPQLKDMTPSFIGMMDGDGRNDALFKWRSQLERAQKLNAKEIEKCIRIINENLFATAMTNTELFKTVLREKDKKERLAPEDKENYFNKVADEIVGKFDIMSFGDNFYKFNGIYYKPIDSIELERIIHFECNKNISYAGRTEIIRFLRVKTQLSSKDFDKEWHKIACKSGILNLITGEVTQPTKSDLNTIYIPHAYNPDPVDSPRVNQFMKDLTGADPIKIQFLYQIAGYCLLKKNMFHKFFIFKGEGGTGKSTFVNLLHKLVGGEANTSHVGLDNFDRDYYLSTTISKLLNIDDDVVDGRYLESTGRFKSLVAGEIISVRQIYQPVISFIPYVKCIFCCNRLPKLMDKTTGLYRRMVLVELNNKVQKPDLNFIAKMTDLDMEFFLFKAVEGIKMAIEEGRFRINQSDMELLSMFKRRQSALNEWLYDTNVTLGDLHNKRTMPLFRQFIEWCRENEYQKVMTNFTFKEDLCALFDLEISFAEVEGFTNPVQVFRRRGEFDPDWRPY